MPLFVLRATTLSLLLLSLVDASLAQGGNGTDFEVDLLNATIEPTEMELEDEDMMTMVPTDALDEAMPTNETSEAHGGNGTNVEVELINGTALDSLAEMDDEMAMGTIGPTEMEDMEDEGMMVGVTMVPSDAMEETMTPNPSSAPPEEEEQTPVEPVEEPATTFPPQEAPLTQLYTCASSASAVDEDLCVTYTSALNNVECDCYYFCEGGSLVQCLDAGESKEFGCPGNTEVVTCYYKAGDLFEEEATSTSAAPLEEAKEALDSLYYTAMVALGALLCFL